MRYVNDDETDPEVIEAALTAGELTFLRCDARGVGWYKPTAIQAVPGGTAFPKIFGTPVAGGVEFSADEETLLAAGDADEFAADDDDEGDE